MLTRLAMMRPNTPITRNEPIAERLRWVVAARERLSPAKAAAVAKNARPIEAPV